MSRQSGPPQLETHVLVSPEARALIDHLALFFERFGFRRNLGRIWATVFLAPRPVSQPELCELVDLSAGLVSSSLKELDLWEMIHPVTLPGQRRVYYRAEERLLRIVHAILSKREVPAVRALHEAARDARAAYAGHDDEQTRKLSKRLSAVEDATRLYSALARVVMVIAHLPPLALNKALRLVETLRIGERPDSVVADAVVADAVVADSVVADAVVADSALADSVLADSAGMAQQTELQP